jgi:hypothetical protein
MGGKGGICFSGSENGKGLPKGGTPKVSEKKGGPIQFSGQSGDKGIPGKAGKGKGSKWAATHD